MTDITPEALEERGFEPCAGGARKHITKRVSLAVGSNGEADLWTANDVIRFPGIHSLADVDSMIRFLEDGETTNESEAR